MDTTQATTRDGALLLQSEGTKQTSGSMLLIARGLATVFGGVFYTGVYVTIVFVYLKRQGTNGITEPYVVDAKVLSYLWFVMSVFALDWARVGSMGFEATGLGDRRLAPGNGLRFMWHADKSWGILTGWLKVAVMAVTLVFRTSARRRKTMFRHYPGRLWWTLMIVQLPLWIAVPLSGLSFNVGRTLILSGDKVSIYGSNETTFDLRFSTLLLETATSRWAQGLPTRPKSPNVFYAPEGTANVSESFYDDKIESYQEGEWITFFIGPVVDQRVEGKVWGIQANVSARIVRPYHNMQLLNVTGFGISGGPSWKFWPEKTGASGYIERGPIYGCTSAILAATELQLVSRSDYPEFQSHEGQATSAPHKGIFELALWQYYNSSIPDPSMQEMTTNDAVASQSLGDPHAANPDILAYGITFDVDSSVGFAELSAAKRTYRGFKGFPSSPFAVIPDYGLDHGCQSCLTTNNHSGCNETTILRCQNQEQQHQQQLQIYSGHQKNGAGIMALENLLLVALTCETPLRSAFDVTCFESWFAANLATGGKTYVGGEFHEPQAPALTPIRMRLAIFKLIGELAIAMMGTGPEAFKGTLTGVKTINDLYPGTVSWKPVLALLCLWCVLLSFSTIFVLVKHDGLHVLDGYQMFKYGGEWKEEMLGCHEDQFAYCERLADIPTTDELRQAEKEAKYGFVGVTLLRRAERSDHPDEELLLLDGLQRSNLQQR